MFVGIGERESPAAERLTKLPAVENQTTNINVHCNSGKRNYNKFEADAQNDRRIKISPGVRDGDCCTDVIDRYNCPTLYSPNADKQKLNIATP